MWVFKKEGAVAGLVKQTEKMSAMSSSCSGGSPCNSPLLSHPEPYCILEQIKWASCPGTLHPYPACLCRQHDSQLNSLMIAVEGKKVRKIHSTGPGVMQQAKRAEEFSNPYQNTQRCPPRTGMYVSIMWCATREKSGGNARTHISSPGLLTAWEITVCVCALSCVHLLLRACVWPDRTRFHCVPLTVRADQEQPPGFIYHFVFFCLQAIDLFCNLFILTRPS